MMSRWILVSLSALTFACDEEPPVDTGMYYSCTEIGCSDGINGQFSPELTAHGDYVFTLDLDGEVTTCALTLPLVDSQSCEGPLQVTKSGSALPESDQSFPSFMIFETGFESYTLTIELDGVELLSWTESPEWEIVRPNGEGCDPVCELASATVAVP